VRLGFFGDSLTEGRPGVSYVDLLRARFPQHEILNYGRGGDSVVGTLDRVCSLDVEGPFDLAFVWTGVNDVLAHVSNVSPWTRRLLGEPWTEGQDAFVSTYRELLAELQQMAQRIVSVAPLFVGEDLDNSWNRQLAQLSKAISEVCSSFENVEFLDLRPEMTDVASNRCDSSFVERSGLATVWEAVALHDADAVDRLSSERGLCYTLDGVHLNSRGAQVVADVLARVIEGNPNRPMDRA
jgi:lysophospholipase L1-like esterase